MQHVDSKLINALSKEAEASSRKRAFHTFHKENDMLNRVLVVGTAGSYAAPHRHAEKFEAFGYIEGEIIVVEFDNDGKLINAYDLRQSPYVELVPMTWHSLICTSKRWAFIEFALWRQKYNPADKEFAPWAPKEGDPQVTQYLKKLTELATILAQKQ